MNRIVVFVETETTEDDAIVIKFNDGSALLARYGIESEDIALDTLKDLLLKKIRDEFDLIYASKYTLTMYSIGGFLQGYDEKAESEYFITGLDEALAAADAAALALMRAKAQAERDAEYVACGWDTHAIDADDYYLQIGDSAKRTMRLYLERAFLHVSIRRTSRERRADFHEDVTHFSLCRREEVDRILLLAPLAPELSQPPARWVADVYEALFRAPA